MGHVASTLCRGKYIILYVWFGPDGHPRRHRCPGILVAVPLTQHLIRQGVAVARLIVILRVSFTAKCPAFDLGKKAGGRKKLRFSVFFQTGAGTW
ncbi:hypothetical protein CU100_17130 [Phyllobacterium endophyticum]|uniref:Uncharacterized protein n=1 Tax=Phyllobacterium endophyticum TaxID=1149773 RepID=A0A2P7AS00_9HYPH|nr:hypothetical protein CU100_17130 [Phyllobacterium endophyticum]